MPVVQERQDAEEKTTYSRASTSRQGWAPAGRNMPDNGDEIEKETKDFQKQKRFEMLLSQSHQRKKQILKVFKPSRKTDSFVYVEKNGKFRAMRKNVFEQQQEMGRNEVQSETFSSLVDFISSKHPDVAVAISFQRNFHNISMIIQGFLSGFTVSEAVFAFNFANENTNSGEDIQESLLYSYRWISLPIHVVFLICFTIGCVAAIDRKMSHLPQNLYYIGASVAQQERSVPARVGFCWHYDQIVMCSVTPSRSE
ncbi:unnamed protein product [Angiostrongylus costaricensis]|uniref:YTH domain-containing protein n=1 Tax=Angiostrongylus costaricensis TaxID=334426 RepID=A0A158PD89_ANGCS|nr:unnamed protein product [Angiostrongylus costaricensis]